jgi:AcrR family transcriptional regulator
MPRTVKIKPAKTKTDSTRDIRAEGKEAMRLGLLDIASQVLEREGPNALSMRHIAEQAGCSTTVLYTLFGGKEGLADGLYLEGFRRLREALEKVKEKNALEQLKSLNRTYRQIALLNPTYYAVMFERPIPEYRPSNESRLVAWGSLEPLINTIQLCITQGQFKKGNAEMMAMELWTIAHGLVSVELAGYFPGKTSLADAMHEKALDDMIRAWSS